MVFSRNSSDQATVLFEDFYYFFHRPQEVFGESPVPPPPPTPNNEIAEQTTGVFDFIIYNETGGGNDGFVVVTQS